MLEQKYNKLSKEEKLIFLAGVFEGEGSLAFGEKKKSIIDILEYK